MSRTGNLLFPENEDDGWVTSIIKALPEEDPKAEKLVSLTIPDPVALEADAAFSELAAENAANEAIFAAGWSAEAVGPSKPPATAPESLPRTALEALDAVVDRAAEGGETLEFGGDPVAVEADAAFAELDAVTATREAIEAAGWTAEAQEPGDIPGDIQGLLGFDAAEIPTRPDAEEEAAAWSATAFRPAPKDLPPAELEAMDRAVAEAARITPRFTEIEDPVGFAADALFAETAAEVAASEAIGAAGWSAEAVGPSMPPAAAPDPDSISQAALEALDAVVDRHAEGGENLEFGDDPVAVEADAAFAELGAVNATREAIEAAGWTAEAQEPGGIPGDIQGLPGFDTADIPTRPDAEEEGAGWPATAFRTDQEILPPAELEAVDRAVAEAARITPRFTEIEDPVGFAADALFAETAAEVAAREAIRAAKLADEADEPAEADEAALTAPTPLSRPLAADEMRRVEDDPVALEADAAFSEIAAELAISDAILAARWSTRALSPGAPVADGDPGQRLAGAGFWEIEDLVRAEAEIAFEDAAYDLAYNTVDSLVTGEAVALAAFDQAIAAGAEPEEALAAAIAAAEAVDPLAFGLARAVAQAPVDEFIFPGPVRERDREAESEPEDAPEDAPEDVPGDTPEGPSVASILGDGLNDDPARDLLEGGAGSDTLLTTGIRFTLEPALPERTGSAFRRDDRDDLFFIPAASAFNPIQGSAAADFIVGTSGADAIAGLEAGDYIYGDRPTNYVEGTHDIGNPLTNPTFAATGGGDVISGGAGGDFIWGGAGNDSIHGDVPATTTDPFDEFPFSLGTASAGDDEIHGGDGDDKILGGGGADTLFGDGGDDRLEGNDGADTLYGGSGGDNLFGYAGDDVLVGGQGDDSLTGGAGADEFRFQGGTGADALARAESLGTDTITDFSAADGDNFGLSDADFGFGNSGTLTDGTNYFESGAATLSASPLDASGGTAGPAVVVIGDGSGSDGFAVYYTDDASAMTTGNSYQIAEVENANTGDVDSGDFNLKA